MNMRRELLTLALHRNPMAVIRMGLGLGSLDIVDALRAQGNTAAAIQQLRSVLQTTRDPSGFVLLGYYQIEIGYWEEALASLSKARGLNPFDPFAWGLAAVALNHLGQATMAQWFHEVALDIERWRGTDSQCN